MATNNFAYYEGLTNAKNLLADIKANLLTAYASGTNAWTILKEEQDAQLRTTKLYLHGKADNGTDMFLLLDNSAMDLKKIQIQSAELMVNASGTITLTNPTNVADFNYVKSASVAPRDVNTPISYFLSVTNSRIILVLQGDPTIDFTGYYKNVLYFGTLKAMDNTDTADVCLSVGSEGNATLTTYGQYTSNCISTVAVLRTKSGILWQKHYPAFITQQQALPLEPTGFNASRWTGKYHLSPIYIVHPFDGYRGTLDGLIAVDKNNILHQDELLVETADPNIKDRYKYFDSNIPYNMFVQAPNTAEGVAVLKAPGV